MEAMALTPFQQKSEHIERPIQAGFSPYDFNGGFVFLFWITLKLNHKYIYSSFAVRVSGVQCLCAPFSRFRTAESSIFINRTRLFSHFINKVSIRYPNPNTRRNHWDRRVGGARLNVVTTRMGNNYVLLLLQVTSARHSTHPEMLSSLQNLQKSFGWDYYSINRSPVCCTRVLGSAVATTSYSTTMFSRVPDTVKVRIYLFSELSCIMVKLK